MATITLTDGDFGSGPANIGEEELFLPDRTRPGMVELVPLTAIDTVEAISNDRSGQFTAAAKASARGFSMFGPVGLAAGVFAVRKVKNVNFSVKLKDGRQFKATTDAITYAALGAARVSGRMSAEDEEAADARADEVIAKYLKETKDAPAAPSGATPAASPSAAAPSPAAAQPAAAPAAEPAKATPQRPVFGRRQR